ncbi:MAG: LacI family transcriptional regulator [Clostridiales bacterium]|nr:LacI family transcriptional regulator [Clostridiales bacterium]
MVTIKEIAQVVGLSASTVSIVLAGKAAERKISEETQKKILDTANQLGYRPNIAARSLRGGVGAAELQVAVFWAQDFRAQMLTRFLEGLRQEIARRQVPVRLVVYPYQNDGLKDMAALTNASDCHAAIICNASFSDMAFLEETQLAIPVVLYNRNCSRYASVNVDDAQMGALAARAFAAHGCRRAAILTGPPVFEGMEIRVQGFRMEGECHGLSVSDTICCDNSLTGGYDAVCRRLRQEWVQALPDALFCGSSMIAHGVLRAFWEAGLLPEHQPKVIAIGNGSEEQDAYSVPSLSVVRLPMEQMAAVCISLLLDTVAGCHQPVSSFLEVEYVARESCGPLDLP